MMVEIEKKHPFCIWYVNVCKYMSDKIDPRTVRVKLFLMAVDP